MTSPGGLRQEETPSMPCRSEAAASLVVPDASVILKWVLPSEDEPNLGQALKLRDAIADGRVRAVVPSLWFYEVGNTLARRRPEHVEHSLGVLSRFDLESATRSPQWLEWALELTQRYGVSFYDASYHAHAIVGHGVFVTADERYIARAGQAGFVIPLAEWTAGEP